MGTIVFGLYLYNKGPLDIRSSKGLAVKAVDLYSIFYTDSVVAGKMYIDKVLRVEGTIKEVSQNASQQQVILFKTGIAEAAINCTMEMPIQNIHLSDKLVIKGICSGIGQGDADLGIVGDVYLTRCYSTIK